MADTLTAVTVSTTAVLLKAANTSRTALLITNNGAGDLYIGPTSGVTTSGATMGLLVASRGAYSDFGTEVDLGDVYGIYSVAAASQNVAVMERA